MALDNTKKTKKRRVTTKYILIFGALLLLTNIILGVVMMNYSIKAVQDLVRQNMLDISNTAADIIDGDKLGSLTEKDVGTDKFKSILDELTAFQKNNNVEYVYAVKKVDNNKFVFTVDADPIDSADFGEEVKTVTDAMISAGNGVAAVDKERAEDEWGNYYSAFSPVFDSNGKVAGVIGVDFDSIWYEGYITDHIISIAIIVAVSILCSVFIFVFFTRNVRKRFGSLDKEISNLSNDIDELADVLSDSITLRHGEDNQQVLTETESDDGDEIENLGTKIQTMHTDFKKYLDYLHDMAYTDALTGVRNTTAYIEMQNALDKEIQEGSANFYLIVFDINDLKHLNDRYGHAVGDKIIRGTGKTLKRVFGLDNSFRIGGDEFLVIFENADEETLNQKLNEVDAAIDKYNESNAENDAKLSISKGFAKFNPEQDKSYKEVFIRADERMYEEKKNK